MLDDRNRRENIAAEAAEDTADSEKETKDGSSLTDLEQERKRRWNEERAEASLRVFAEYCAEQERQEAEEAWEYSRNISVPDSVKERMYQTADRLQREQKNERKKAQQRRRMKSLSKICASVLLVFAVAGAALTIDAEALKVKLYKFFSVQNEKDMTINFREEDFASKSGEETNGLEEKIVIDAELPEELHTILYPEKMKKGYTLMEAEVFGEEVFLNFWDKKKESYIVLNYLPIDNNVQVDTEYSENTNTKVNGQEALLQKTESGEWILYWPKDDYLIILIGGKSIHTKKEMLKMAESVRWYDRDVFVTDNPSADD